MSNNNISLKMKVKHHFKEMDFFYDEKRLGSDLDKKKQYWGFLVYFLLSLGIFSRQITQFPKVEINFSNIKWSVLIASFIFGFAVLPYIMRWISRRSKGKPTGQHIISAFGFGFFLDFANNNIMPKILEFFSLI